jgi:predicted alpha/beta hydrolase
MANMAADVPGGVGKQFAQWIATGRFEALDGLDYRTGMAAVRFPVLLMAGSHDLIAPPAAVGLAQELVSGPTTWIQLGTEHGHRADYGHGDLVIGRHAPEEIFPLISTFLEKHSTPV